MFKCLSLVMSLWLCSMAFAADPVQVIKALGASKKGQFVAIEEYGYDAGMKMYYSRIKLMNVWKKEYVSPVVEVEGGARHPDDLLRIRETAKQRAAIHFEKYNIITSG